VIEDADHPRGAFDFTFRQNAGVHSAVVRARRGGLSLRQRRLPAKLRESLLHFASRGVMNIEGWARQWCSSCSTRTGAQRRRPLSLKKET